LGSTWYAGEAPLSLEAILRASFSWEAASWARGVVSGGRLYWTILEDMIVDTADIESIAMAFLSLLHSMYYQNHPE
jgi:hypothetical protein